MNFNHKSVMLNECIDGLSIKPNGIYVDCTAGGGGHSSEILKHLTTGRLIAIDKDEDALSVCKERLNGNVTLVHSDFKNVGKVLEDLRIDKVDGFLADLGVSSYQIDTPERGFSYMATEAPLDMRMDSTQKLTAKDIVNSYEENELFAILRDYGEENFAKQIAHNIYLERQSKQFETCGDLVAVIDKSIPASVRHKGGHPAKRTFQALRIEVNKELDGLDEVLHTMANKLNAGGRIAVITFHSLEDRIVKHCFTDLITDCICPPNLPICVCNHRAQGVLVNKKPILPSQEELAVNTRSQSAKLRIFEKK